MTDEKLLVPEAMPVRLADIVDDIFIDPRKLTHYALNPDSPLGKHKAVLFARVLGFTRENHTILLSRLREGAMQAAVTLHSKDGYGTRYTADISIKGTNEKRHAVVRTGWIIPPDSKEAHLTTLYVKVKK
jgi:filamentous hemagglutinin